jgi:hypothetical protein
MLPAQQPNPETADDPAVSARRAEDGPLPTGSWAEPDDAPTPEGGGHDVVGGEYEPL